MFTAKAWRWTSDVFWLSPSPWKQSTHVSISNTPHHVTAIFGSTVCHISKNWCRSIGILYILCGENQSEDICLWRKTYNYAHCSAQDVVSQRPLVVKSLYWCFSTTCDANGRYHVIFENLWPTFPLLTRCRDIWTFWWFHTQHSGQADFKSELVLNFEIESKSDSFGCGL